jgi:predicted SnoaL-like aldol condensation-catalyzing enzyme
MPETRDVRGGTMAADLKALAKQFNDEVFGKGNVDLIDELVADDFVDHQEFPGLEPTKEGLKNFVKLFHTAFSDIEVETLSIGLDGDELWVHSVFRGTHTGEFAGVPPTGNSVSLEMMDRVKVRDEQAIEHWGVSDDLGMMTQLGVIPEMG